MTAPPSVIEVTGELDLSTVARWEEDVEAAGHESAAVVLDLSDVRFIDSAGVRTLFKLVRALESEGRHLSSSLRTTAR